VDPAAWLKDTLSMLSIWPNSCLGDLMPLVPEFVESLKYELRTKLELKQTMTYIG
jgi:hypothetical protein